MTTRPKRKNYLNNKDILAEIKKSKNTYCTYRTPEDAEYDIILDSLNELLRQHEIKNRKGEIVKTLTGFELAKENRARRLTSLDPDNPVKPEDISTQDLVIRVHDWSHVPKVTNDDKITLEDCKDSEDLNDQLNELEAVEEQTNYNVADTDPPWGHLTTIITGLRIKKMFMKVNFPPFTHWKFNNNNEPYMVGISHWKGFFDDDGNLHGEFSTKHGQITDTLVNMLILLVNRNATKSNWRSYTYVDEFKGQAIVQLVEVCLQFNEARSDNPFSYYTSIMNNSFTKILLQEKTSQDIRDDILEQNNLAPSNTRQLNNELAMQEQRQKLIDELEAARERRNET